MPKKGKRDLAKEQFWRKTLERFSASGKRQSEFCKDEGLKVDAMLYWRNTILQRDAMSKSAKPAAKPKAANAFVPVNVAEDTPKPAAKDQKAVAQIVFSGGSVLLFEHADLNILKHLLQALKETAN